jgi:hypothetical protein
VFFPKTCFRGDFCGALGDALTSKTCSNSYPILQKIIKRLYGLVSRVLNIAPHILEPYPYFVTIPNLLFSK